MTSYRFALYDAFSADAFGGSQAAVIENALTIDTERRRKIAREIGMPATAFIDDIGDDRVQAQFMSTVMELPMCGHGTICLFTHLLESGLLDLDEYESRDLDLRLPMTSATVELSRRDDGRYRVMLDIRPPSFVAPPPHIGKLLTLLGLDAGALDDALPAETARGDFIHLVVPLAGLAAMRAIKPDFNGMVDFCNENGIETIAVFCREVDNPDNTIHVRDFCPAVGVSESAAAGTTNAALTSYLLRHGLVPTDAEQIKLCAEQGLELGRPSQIQSVVGLVDGGIARLQVGGVATKIFAGQVFL
ncbi:MAG: PhzF family phenazine biosynthesis protein [Gammaproteobacteria bacterium]|nr:PhzF family phenazine biosynthesis protein [Gammaproteobacteria bacterium]